MEMDRISGHEPSRASREISKEEIRDPAPGVAIRINSTRQRNSSGKLTNVVDAAAMMLLSTLYHGAAQVALRGTRPFTKSK